MDSFEFPFPFTFDCGLFVFAVGRNCVVLKRKDREYPHVTFFYERKRGTNYWWPHVTWRRRGGGVVHKELAKFRLEHGQELERRFRTVVTSRFETLLTPVSLDELGERDWRIVMPSMNLITRFIDMMLVRRNVLSIERLGELSEDPEQVVALFECLLENSVAPQELAEYRPTRALGALRITDDDIEQGWLYGYDLGHGGISWFMAPADIFGMNAEELFRTLMPEAFDAMKRIAEVLELPFHVS